MYSSAAGGLAAGVVGELSPNLRQIRDSLAVLVELLDRHFAESKGPEPYPWSDTKALRERLATVYLASRQAARMSSELARAVSPTPSATEPLDPNQLVEQAVALARFRFGEECALSIDAGDVPPVRGHHGPLVLLLARLLVCAADAARPQTGGGSVDVRTRRQRRDPSDVVVFEIANAAGRASWDELHELAEMILEPLGGEMSPLGDGGLGVVISVPVAR